MYFIGLLSFFFSCPRGISPVTICKGAQQSSVEGKNNSTLVCGKNLLVINCCVLTIMYVDNKY